MTIAFVDASVFVSNITRALPSVVALAPGDLLLGRIIKRCTDGQYRVDFNGLQSTAVLRFPVAVGETILSEVIDIGPPLKLKIQPPRPSANPGAIAVSSTPWRELTTMLRQLHQNIAQCLESNPQKFRDKQLPDNIRQSLQVISDYLRPLDVSTNTDAWLARLSAIVTDSGLYFEKKLAQLMATFFRPQTADSDVRKIPLEVLNPVIKKDVKPHLLLVSKFFKSSDAPLPLPDIRPHWNRVQTGVSSLLDHIGQQHRQMSQQRSDTHAAFAFHHLFYLNSFDQKACLRIYTPRRTSASDHNNTRISLLLELNRVGSVRADLAMIEDDLQIVFFVATKDLKHHFEQQLHHLTTGLGGLFPSLRCHVHVSRKKISEFAQVAIEPIAENTIDLRI